MGKLRRRSSDLLLFTLFGLAMLIEVGLITFQQWRGVTSHFNRATPFDAAVLAWIESLIIFATVVIFEVTRRSFQQLPTSSDMTLAIRGGMGLLCLSCLLGFVQVVHGNRQIAQGLPPEIFGEAGVMKFMHGAPMHAIQILPILAWTLKRMNMAEDQRLRAVACTLASVVGLTIFSLLQTFTGRARFDIWWMSGIVLLLSVGLLMVPTWIALGSVNRRTVDNREMTR